MVFFIEERVQGVIRLLISSCVLASMLSIAWGTELLVASGNNVNVREGPALTARVLTQVNKGDTLDRLGSEGEWVHVNIHGDNMDGWIHEDFVREGTSTGTPGSVSDSISGMTEYRLDLGGDACPDSSSWREFTAEIKRGNWDAELGSILRVARERNSGLWTAPSEAHIQRI